VDRLLERSRGTWFVRHHTFVFTDVSTLNAYNAHAMEIRRLGEEERLLQQQLNQEKQAQLDMMRQMAN
jgi:hypothetical protein